MVAAYRHVLVVCKRLQTFHVIRVTTILNVYGIFHHSVLAISPFLPRVVTANYNSKTSAMISIFKRQIKLFFVCLFFITLKSSFGQSAEEILTRYFAASSNGEISKWSEIKTLYATSIGYYSQKSFETKDNTFDPSNLGYAKIYKRWPDEQKEELFNDSLFKYRDGSFYFLKNRRVIFLGYMDPIETAPDEKSTFNFYPIRIKNYMDKSKSIAYNGKKLIPGKSTPSYEIVIKEQGLDHILLFNTESYLLEAIYFQEPDIYWLISDYKLFDGYLIPTYVASMKNGVVFSWTRYKTFEFNIEFDENKFNPRYEGKNQTKALSTSMFLNLNETTLDEFIKANFLGKRVFIDVWATWCGPCKWEFRNYDSAYYSVMEREAIELVYLSIDKNSDRKKWEADVANLGLKGFHVMANKGLIKSIQKLVFGDDQINIPRYILFNEHGQIVSKDFVRPSNPLFKEELNRVLNKR